MYKHISSFIVIKISIYFFIFSLCFVFLNLLFIKKIYADNIPSVRVCVYTNTGSPLPASAGGVVRFRDKVDGCFGGPARYLEIGKTEVPSGSQVNFDNNGSNCAIFAPWGPACSNSLNSTQRSWLHNSYINVPGLGSQRRSPSASAVNFGCVECRPGYAAAFVKNYSCDLCRSIRFSNVCGTINVNIICTPQSNIEVQSDVPPDCVSEHDFIIEGWDNIQGAGSIRQLSLRIETDTATPKTFDVNINSDGSGGYEAILLNEYWLRRPYSFPYYNVRLLDAGCGSNACIINGKMRIIMHVEGLNNAIGEKDVWAFASQWIGGRNTGFQLQGDFLAGNTPEDKTIEWTPDPDEITLGESAQLVWDRSECFAVYIYSSGDVSCSPSSFYGLLGRGTVSTSGTGSGSCRARADYINTCGIQSYTDSLLVIPAATVDPWMMTALGDAYASNGYTLEMDTVSFNVPKGASDEAYFSTYIISHLNNNLVTDRPSYRSYLLRTYNDANRNKTGEGFNFYEQLLALAQANGCSYETVLPNTGCPNGSHIYFINGNASLTGWLWQAPSTNRACAVIANGNISIPAGSDKADDVDRVDAFLITDGSLIVQADDEVLYVNGSGIANTIELNRDYSGDDPSEIFVYDPKYIDLLRECLGENYSYKVREYEYSNPE